MNLLTLHRAGDRHSYFAADRKPIFFDDALRCWIATDPQLADRLLQHANLAVADYVDAYESLQRQSGAAFPNLLHAFRHIPICLNGAEHREARRRVAEAFAGRRVLVASVLPELVGRSFAPLAAAEEVDLLSEVLLPLIDAIMALLLGIDAESLWRFRRVPGIFDRMIGLRRRKELELEVGIARSALASQREDADPLFTLMALGHDALLGTIGESLHRLIAADPGRRLSEIAYPAVPIETGVPYVERVVKQAFELDGNSFRGGDRIRILMQAFAYSGSEQSRLHMFGVGPHACIGRQLSLDLWSRITAVLAQVRRRAEVVKHALRTNDYIWTCPSELRIRLYDDDL